jgi:glucose-6-phosphate 1-dehydrogenase
VAEPPVAEPTNPLTAGVETGLLPAPATVVIFGGSGDLARRKLLPALYNLAVDGLLPACAIVGFSREELDRDRYRKVAREGTDRFSRRPVEERAWADFERLVDYVSGAFDDPAAYARLRARLEAVEREHGLPGSRLFYLAIPPSLIGTCVGQLQAAGLVAAADDARFTRLVVEKPIGRDLATARELNEAVARVFDERQVFRIDHYLGKETVQNILVFRFTNEIFEPLWHRAHVDHVQITAAESIGVEGRGSYYEEAGALRDMVQNHLLQLLCLVAMEPPATYDAEGVRDEKTKVLRAVQPIRPADVDRVTVRGQYGPGAILGKPVPGYREEPGVAPGSTTETYAAVRLELQNWRWAGVPFYLRSGKHLPKRVSEIALQFRRPPQLLFGGGAADLEPNALVLRIQPDEGIAIRFGAKLPVQDFRLRAVTMDFRYGTSFGVATPEAYERLLLDAIRGDGTLFARNDWVELAWSVLAPIQEAWATGSPPSVPSYEAGTWGPPEADRLLEREGRRWRRP